MGAGRFLRSRTLKYGSGALTGVLMVLGILTVINFLSSRYHWRFDATVQRIFSLSDQTVGLLGSLDKDVVAVAFFRTQQRSEFEHLLQEYAYHSKRFSYRFVDPDREPREARRYNVKAYGTTVVESGGKTERISTTEERDLTNAIAKAIRDEEKVIYFLTGHGEASTASQDRDGYYRARALLLESNYVVRDSLMLSKTRGVPADCDLLVVASPKVRLYSAEVDSIRSYLEGGGDALFLLDPGVETGLEPVLLGWSVSVNDDYVVESSSMGKLYGFDYSMPMVARYGDHPVTEKHHGLMTVFMMARSVTRQGTVPGAEAVELAMTSPASWGEVDLSTVRSEQRPAFDPTVDRRGPLSLGMAVSAPPRDRDSPAGKQARRKTLLVVFGDSDFANNQLIGEVGNGDLFMNAVSWLMEEGALIAIRPKERRYRPVWLTEGQGQRLKWFSLVVLPAIPVIVGVIVWWRRR